jgi:dienelactone hydrolase
LIFEDDLSQLIDRSRPAMLFQGNTVEELQEWQVRFRSVLTRLLGSRPDRTELDLQVQTKSDCGTFVRQRVRYQTEPGVFVPAYLLVPKNIPKGQRVPGLLCLHGHSHWGKDSVSGIDDTPERRAQIEQKGYNYGQKFAEQGYVVLAPDMRGFGERRPGYPGPRTDHCTRNYLCATLMGTTVVALNLCDLEAALDVLQSLEYVDGERLGCAGLSFGGRMTMMISAMDERIKIAVASGCMSLYQERYQALKRCGAQLIPGLLRYGDTPEIFSLIAPRPLVIEWGLKDRLAPHDWAERGLARIRRAYEAGGVPERLVLDRFDGGHLFHMTVAREVLQRWRADVL